jgi:hypothetical protein
MFDNLKKRLKDAYAQRLSPSTQQTLSNVGQAGMGVARGFTEQALKPIARAATQPGRSLAYRFKTLPQAAQRAQSSADRYLQMQQDAAKAQDMNRPDFAQQLMDRSQGQRKQVAYYQKLAGDMKRDEMRGGMAAGGRTLLTAAAGGAGRAAIGGGVGLGAALSGGMAAMTGDNISEAIGEGAGRGLQTAGLLRFTNPVVNPIVESVGRGRPLVQRLVARGFTHGGLNVAEDNIFTLMTEGRFSSVDENVLSFGLGALMSPLVKYDPKNSFLQITDSGDLKLNRKLIRDHLGQFAKQTGVKPEKFIKQAEEMQKWLNEPIRVNRGSEQVGEIIPRWRAALQDQTGGVNNKTPDWMTAKPEKQPTKPNVAQAPKGDIKATTPATPKQEATRRLDTLINYPDKLRSMGYSKKQINQIGVKEAKRILDQDIPPFSHKSFPKSADPNFEPTLGANISSKKRPTVIPPETTDVAEAATNITGKGGLGAMTDDIRKSYQTWVNTRQAASGIDQYARKQAFTELDSKGVQGLFEVQSGSTQGKYKHLRNFFNKKYKDATQAGVEMKYQQNYLPQLWDNSQKEIESVFGKSLGLKPGFTMEKIIESYKKGIEGGLKPKFTKISDIAGWYEGRVNKAIADKQFFDKLTRDGIILPANKAPSTWQTLDPDSFPKFRIRTPDGTYSGTYKAPPEMAKLVNNYLSYPDGPISSIANYASYVKQIVLSAGIPRTALNFHGVNILARRILSSKTPIQDAISGVFYLARPSAAKKMVDNNLKLAQRAVKSGLTISGEGWQIGRYQKPPSSNVVGKVFDKVVDFNQRNFEKQLFDEVIPAFKLNYWDTLQKGFVKDGMSVSEADRSAARVANDIFGGINTEQIGRSRQLQNFIRATILAGDWAETNVRLAGKVPVSVIAKTPEGRAYRQIMTNLAGVYIGANIINKLSSGNWMWQNDPGNEFNIHVGYTKDGKKRYIRPFGTAADFVRLPVNVISSLAKGDVSQIPRIIANRLSVPAGVAMSLLANVDYRGQPIYGRDKYGQEMGLVKSIGGIAGEISRLGTPPMVKAGIDRATGRTGNEEFLAQSTEAPIRYQGGAYSKLQQELDPVAKGEGLEGKELYDFRQSIRGQTFGKNQKEWIKKQGLQGVMDVLSVKEQNKALQEIEENGATLTSADSFIYMDEAAGQFKTINIGKVSSMPAKTETQKALKEKERWTTSRAVYRSGLTEQEKQAAYKKLGVSAFDAETDFIGNQDVPIKAAWVKDTLRTIPREKQLDALRLMVNAKTKSGKSLLTDAVAKEMGIYEITKRLKAKKPGSSRRKAKAITVNIPRRRRRVTVRKPSRRARQYSLRQANQYSMS